MKFLYWNINNKPLEKLTASLAAEHNIDVIVLSECDISTGTLQSELKNACGIHYHLLESPYQDPLILTHISIESFKLVLDQPQVSVRRFAPPKGLDFLIFIVQFPSKLYQDELDQFTFSRLVSDEICRQERKFGHRRTIVMGDFNMNPFEPGMTGADSLHAVMSKRIAEKKHRMVNGKQRYFFYNPMWNHFGDYPSGPPGTYYYDSGKQINYYWNMFDQVLLRPELLTYFNEAHLKILTSTEKTDLVNTSGIPQRKKYSDHLPITFSLDFTKGA